MIIRLDKTFEQNSKFPNTNWYPNELDNLVIDETTQEGQNLAQKVINMAGYFDLVIQSGVIVDVVENPQLKAEYLNKIAQERATRQPTVEERLEATEEALLALLFGGAN